MTRSAAGGMVVAAAAGGDVALVALAVACLVVAVVAVAVALVGARRRAAVAGRIEALADRLDAPVAVAPGIDGSLQRLSSAVDRSALEGARRAETLLVRALDAIPQGVVLYARDGKQTLRNRAAAAFLDVRHGGPELDRVMWELLAPGFAGEQGTRTVEVPGPALRTYLLTALPLWTDDAPADAPSSGRVDGVAMVMDDISERRRVDDLRRDFVANISHELKTPVGALGLLAETLVEETAIAGGALVGEAAGDAATEGGAATPADDGPRTTSVVPRLAARMQHEALRIGRTIDDLLELSRIEVGEPSRRAPVGVRRVLAEAAERAQPAADLRGVHIEVACEPASLTVCADRRQLVSAVANLLDNAIKYSEPGGSVDAIGRAEGGCVELVVVDRGIGIDPPHLDRIFERFYRVDAGRSRDTGGTGLGLAIVRHVVTNHGGEVRVESTAGAGSTFTLRIPPDGSAAPTEVTT